jgi:porphobilinogen synthase
LQHHHYQQPPQRQAGGDGRQRQEEEQERIYKDVLAQAGLRSEHLVCPLFVSESAQKQPAAGAMPGVELASIGGAAKRVQEVADAGISSIIVFGIPALRDAEGSAAGARDGVVQRAVKEIKAAFGRSVTVATDVCLCQYNLSGHCGILDGKIIDNDSTIRMLARIAESHADAGADIVAPSAMMDGQVAAIRQAIRKRAKILSYSAKHASSLYAPFRSAAFFSAGGTAASKKSRGGAKGTLDKSPYQVSYATPSQAMREIEQDIEEGADMVMVKPGLAYLDLVRMAKERFADVPVAVQNVSGEYAMVKAAARRGWIDEEEWKVASVSSIRRAGADMIISYFALDIARYLQ